MWRAKAFNLFNACHSTLRFNFVFCTSYLLLFRTSFDFMYSYMIIPDKPTVVHMWNSISMNSYYESNLYFVFLFSFTIDFFFLVNVGGFSASLSQWWIPREPQPHLLQDTIFLDIDNCVMCMCVCDVCVPECPCIHSLIIYQTNYVGYKQGQSVVNPALTAYVREQQLDIHYHFVDQITLIIIIIITKSWKGLNYKWFWSEICIFIAFFRNKFLSVCVWRTFIFIFENGRQIEQSLIFWWFFMHGGNSAPENLRESISEHSPTAFFSLNIRRKMAT